LNLTHHIIDYDFTYIPWYSLSTWVNEHEIKKINQNENNLPNDNFETFIVGKNLENSEYMIHNFQTNY
jgi:hypothetical protein